MIKKLVIGGLALVLVGTLGVGIYNYAQGNSSLHAGQARAQGNGGDQGHHGGRGDDFSSPGYGNESYAGRAEGNTAPGNGRGGGNRVDQGERDSYGDGTGTPNPQANVSEWLTFSGEVVSVDMTSLTLQTDDGQTLSIQLGPEWFWSDQGVPLVPGERVTVLAFEEDGQIKAGQISLDGNGTSLTLRDSSGRPLWAGRGGGRRQ